MLFFRLGLKNAWRNLSRSLLAILSMAFACAFLTYAFSLSRGYAAEAFAPYRSLAGGDVLVYPYPFKSASAGSETTLSFQRLQYSPFSDLADYHPELFESGFLGREDHRPLNAESLADLAAQPGVRAVSPSYKLPAQIVLKRADRDFCQQSNLRGRDPALDEQLVRHPSEYVTEGRWFDSEDEGKLVAVISRYQHYYGREIADELWVGDTLRLALPRVYREEGSFRLDYGDETMIELEIIGILEIETRRLTWSANSSFFSESLYMILDEVQLPLATWQRIWQEVADGEYQPEQAALIMDNVAYLEDALASLAVAFPQFGFVSGMERGYSAQLSRINETPPLQAPDTAFFYLNEVQSQSFSEDMRLPLTIALLMNAALVVAANLLIVVGERKKEIGILKAVGATRGQVVIMALAEAMTIAAIGGAGGFLVIRLQSFLNQLGASLPLSELLWSLCKDTVFAMSAALSVATLFGLLPALQMARLSVMEVLRNE